ncbi:PAS domain S-box protein [Allochromatium humboldtianum]|uniref:histidine kinase n=1 Tax=Allochromatium humboldtianum TaxID=504901 RepID=A0A850RI58_9GAMM|nr:hybrid sensor histidine kinase/response regulator [Allochromatium humboldtianum]NVZ11137.1 PAS domain S-box protein [Allochromatium humboldtianum]
MGVLDTALCLNWLQTSTDPQTPLPDLTTSAEFMPLARQVLASGRPVRQTLALDEAARTHRLDLILTPMLGAAGETTGVFVCALDLTETLCVEQALRESETQFRLMFDLATVGMAVIDPSTRRVLRVNQRLCRILGYEAGELLGMSFQDLTHPEDRWHDRRRFRRAALRLDTDYFTEKRYVRKDGTVVWALVNATFIRDAHGDPVRSVAAIIDITDRREAETRARDLAAVVESSSDFIGIAGLDRRGLYINPAGRSLVGLDAEQDITEIRIEDFFMPEDLEQLRQSILPVVESAGRWSGEFRFRHFVTGEPIDVFYDALRIDDPNTRRPLHYATVTRDIRTEKAAEQALREADRRKDEFLAVLGHELRNPMAPIRHAVEILRALGVDGDPRIRWAIEVLDRQTAHMGRLLDDLLDVSRIVQGRIELEPVELRVRELLQQAADGARALMEEHRHRFVCRLPAPGWRVLGDPVRLSQILLNILVNAANYTPPGGEIRIDSRIEGDSVLIQVRDNGQGMTAEQLDSLFGLFTRGPHASDADNGGLGLGLAIARRLAELHGGRLEARSDGLGRGTELCLRLPVLTDAPRMNVSASPDDPPAPPAGEKPRVLVVDDDPDVVDALAMLLEILGYPVDVARCGPDALDLVQRQCPRVALLDIGLPGMDGLEIARRLRADYPDPKRLKLVALTGLGHEQARERSLAAGFDEHLVKPLGRQALLALLESLG